MSDKTPFYILVSREAVIGASKNYMNNDYIKSVMEGMDELMSSIPDGDMGQVFEDSMYQHFIDKPGEMGRGLAARTGRYWSSGASTARKRTYGASTPSCGASRGKVTRMSG